MLFPKFGFGTKTGIKCVAEVTPKQHQQEFPCPFVLKIFAFLPTCNLKILPNLSKFYQYFNSRYSIVSLSPLSFPRSSRTHLRSSTFSLASSLPFSVYSSIFKYVGFPGIYQVGLSICCKKMNTLIKFFTQIQTLLYVWNTDENVILQLVHSMPKLKKIALDGVCCQVKSNLVNALIEKANLCPFLEEIDSMRLPNLTVQEITLLYSHRPSLHLCVQSLPIKPQIMILSDLLKSQDGYKRFVRYLKQAVEPDGAFFWREVMVYQQLPQNESAEDKALTIWKQYLEVGAPFEVEIGETTWKHIKYWMNLVRSGRLARDGLKDQPEVSQICPSTRITPCSDYRYLPKNQTPSTDTESDFTLRPRARSPQSTGVNSISGSTKVSPATHLRALLIKANYSPEFRPSISPYSHYISLLRRPIGDQDNAEISNVKESTSGSKLLDELEGVNSGKKGGLEGSSKGEEGSGNKGLEGNGLQIIVTVQDGRSTNSTPRQKQRQSSIVLRSTGTIRRSPIVTALRKIPRLQISNSNNFVLSSPSAENLIHDSHIDSSPSVFQVDQDIRDSTLFFQTKPVILPSGSQCTTIPPSAQTTPCRSGLEENESSTERKFRFSKVGNLPASHPQSLERTGGSPPRLERVLFPEGLPLPTSTAKLIEHPPLLHIFDLALDEIYVNMLVQDYPKFCQWEKTETCSSKSGNMALDGSTRYSTSDTELPYSRGSTEQTETQNSACCCIIC